MTGLGKTARVAVASRSFSKNLELRARLLEKFPRAVFNEAGESLEGEALIDFLRSADGAVVGMERVDGALLDAVPTLRVVSKYGVGVDGIDVRELQLRGVRLSVAPGVNATAVAEIALFLTIGVLRRVPEALNSIAGQMWKAPIGADLSGSTVGLVGVGHVGSAFAELLSGFDCEVIGHDIRPFNQHRIRQVSLDEVLAESRVVSIHVPLLPETRCLIGAAEFYKMRSDAVLVNTARGSVVDERALIDALRERQIAGAGLDVLEHEPPALWEIAAMPNVLLTPHIAGTSRESVLAMGLAAIRGLSGDLG